MIDFFKIKKIQEDFKSSVGALKACHLVLSEYSNCNPVGSHEEERFKFWSDIQKQIIKDLFDNIECYDYSLDFKNRNEFVKWFLDYALKSEYPEYFEKIQIRYRGVLNNFKTNPSVINARTILKAHGVTQDRFTIVWNDRLGVDRVVLKGFVLNLKQLRDGLKTEGWELELIK
jgi:hypothetical protein